MVSPLVPPGPALTPEERTRYARHLLLPGVGAEGQRRVRAAKVLFIGAGGLGSPAALYLAAAGVGTIGIVDDDVVELTNLQRQILHGAADLGRPKVDSARDRLLALDPGLNVVTHELRLEAATVLEVFAEYDLVIDGADNFPTRSLASKACVVLGLPHVWASVHRFDAQISVWWPGGGDDQNPCYHCVFPDAPAPGLVPSCATGGVLGATVGAVGSVLATEAIKLIAGIGEPLLGRLLVHDGLAQRWDAVRVRRRPDCRVCGTQVDSWGWEEAHGIPDGAGNPTAVSADTTPARPGVTVRELAALLEGEKSAVPMLIDVREPGEREIVTIPGARAFPLDRVRRGDVHALPRDQPVYVYCKSGGRSAEAVDLLREAGVDARDVLGGVLAWIDQVDPALPSY